MYDIIIDVIVNGRALLPEDIPQSVSDHIMAAQDGQDRQEGLDGLENGLENGEIEYGGVRYEWSIRPCVYP